MSSFVALDFETANGSPESICSVGMVKVIDHQIIETFYTLVNPEDYFSNINIKIHKIKPSDVTNSPTFDVVFPYMMDFIGTLPVVAHNAKFDMTVLFKSLIKHQIEIPELTYFCSCILARKTVNNHRYGLAPMMDYYNIDFKGHHHALNDAKACAIITYRLLKHYPDLDSVLSIYGKTLTDKKYV
ncbi:3'-5' exonuclease [Mammaliicoccus sciuri]|uniref:3'-5' exonuclease n=1 Tax=Mammaliicoccus sciuri TaxID=1296 RepID=UPI001E421934|nr:3'-5' exonuclease [Mammaliicoccus sciuri]MCD8875358.1 3'-5' exonuclease [Mammaliicoccus sciuri]MCJ0911603.1 3'-5' exonuclease [Mammaliicoccus sciuri]